MEAYIVAGYRSAIGKAKRGGFKNYRTDDLAVDVIKHLSSLIFHLIFILELVVIQILST